MVRLKRSMARKALWLFIAMACSGWARGADREYALILDEPPVAQRAASRGQLAHLRAAQDALRTELARRKVPVTGAVQTLLNAVFVHVSEARAAQLRNLAGVRRVVWLPPLRHHLDRALGLVNAAAAWSANGGPDNAGAGVRIAIIDTGIDQNHAAFQDPSLVPPVGFPTGDTDFTNTKIIVARSYVDLLPNPDETSPRDHNGAGTAAAMIAAGVPNNGPIATITGMAPKAFLGNYRVFGSTGVNDTTLSSVVIQALAAAFNDGMNIATLPVGDAAVFGPLDYDVAACGGNCDVLAQAVETAIAQGMTVVVSAGNDGTLSDLYPTLNTINSPGTAPSAITVGASTNAHMMFSAVRVDGGSVFDAAFGDGFKPSAPVTAPLVDVTAWQADGLGCGTYPAGVLNAAFALAQRGNCSFAQKVANAAAAGAAGVILIQTSGSDVPSSPLGLGGLGIPAVMIGSTPGAVLRALLQSSPGQPVTIDPALHAVDAPDANTVAAFSSRGPAAGGAGLKPELVAVGTGLYTATQNGDPTGALYDPSGYIGVSGSSFAVPMVAGAAALVKQAHPDYSPAQIKSALVASAGQDVTDQGAPARVTAVGAGRLDAGAAVAAGATISPAAISFGPVAQASLPIQIALQVTNTSAAAATLNFTVVPRDGDSRAQVSLSPASLTLAPGQADTVAVALTGSAPDPGSYEGYVRVDGAGAALRVPYLYVATDGTPNNIFPVVNGEFTGVVSDPIPWVVGFKLIDRYGLPVVNFPVRFSVDTGGGAIQLGDAQTDVVGVAAAHVLLGSVPGDQIFRADAGGLTVYFYGYAVAPAPVTPMAEPLARTGVRSK